MEVIVVPAMEVIEAQAMEVIVVPAMEVIEAQATEVIVVPAMEVIKDQATEVIVVPAMEVIEAQATEVIKDPGMVQMVDLDQEDLTMTMTKGLKILDNRVEATFEKFSFLNLSFQKWSNKRKSNIPKK